MNFWSKPSTTTLFLAIIAGLLFVQIIQNMDKGRGRTASRSSDTTQVVPMGGAGHPPMGSPERGGSGTTPMGADGEFDPTLMIMAAMNCPNDSTMTLDAPACSGPQAQERRDSVHTIYAQNPSIRAVFDAIVEKFGEQSLTAQAIQIRRARIAQEK